MRSHRFNASRDGPFVYEWPHTIVNEHDGILIIWMKAVKVLYTVEDGLLSSSSTSNDIDRRLVATPREHLLKIRNPRLKADDHDTRHERMLGKVGNRIVNDGTPAKFKELFWPRPCTHPASDTTCKDDCFHPLRHRYLPAYIFS